MNSPSTLPTIPLRRKNEPCCVAVAPSLGVDETAAAAVRCRALGDPSRVKMLDLLVQASEPLCVCDLTPHFAQNQPTVSHHLKVLRDAGLIDTEKRGIWSYYWATERGTRALFALQSLI